jgi:SAM-dependent methyltransferase
MNPVEYRRMFDAEDSHWWYVGLHKLIVATVQRESRRLGRPLQIFDAGCGTGRLCQLLAGLGHHVSGCDASADALQFCRQRGVDRVFQADLNALELEPEAFDVITSIDVLYHTGIIDDVAVMGRLRFGLRPGGLLILNLVAHEWLRSTHDIAVHTRERYTKHMLCLRLQQSGFTIINASYRVSVLFPVIALYRLVVRLISRNTTHADAVVSDVSSPPSFLNFLLLKTIEAENVLVPIVPLPFGSSLFIEARKPSADSEGMRVN